MYLYSSKLCYFSQTVIILLNQDNSLVLRFAVNLSAKCPKPNDFVICLFIGMSVRPHRPLLFTTRFERNAQINYVGCCRVMVPLPYPCARRRSYIVCRICYKRFYLDPVVRGIRHDDQIVRADGYASRPREVSGLAPPASDFE